SHFGSSRIAPPPDGTLLGLVSIHPLMQLLITNHRPHPIPLRGLPFPSVLPRGGADPSEADRVRGGKEGFGGGPRNDPDGERRRHETRDEPAPARRNARG